MTPKKRGLGRGLDTLLGVAAGDTEQAQLRSLPIERLARGRFQPRTDMREDTLQELAESIRAQGVVQPIVVRPATGAGYEIVAGERRWRAAQLAGLAEVPAVVREVTDQAAMAVALIENIQREDLNPLEEATALKRLVGDVGLTHQQTAEAVGRSRAAVTNLLRLLELDPAVQELVRVRALEMGHARALLGLAPEAQREVARLVRLRGLSVRETERLVRQRQPGRAGPKAHPAVDPDVRRLEEDLSARLGAKVSLDHSGSGKGRLVIRYASLDELDGILERIR